MSQNERSPKIPRTLHFHKWHITACGSGAECATERPFNGPQSSSRCSLRCEPLVLCSAVPAAVTGATSKYPVDVHIINWFHSTAPLATQIDTLHVKLGMNAYAGCVCALDSISLQANIMAGFPASCCLQRHACAALTFTLHTQVLARSPDRCKQDAGESYKPCTA
jgi:hypothetical protein